MQRLSFLLWAMGIPTEKCNSIDILGKQKYNIIENKSNQFELKSELLRINNSKMRIPCTNK